MGLGMGMGTRTRPNSVHEDARAHRAGVVNGQGEIRTPDTGYPAYSISNAAPSTARTPVQVGVGADSVAGAMPAAKPAKAPTKTTDPSTTDALVLISRRLARATARLTFTPLVAHVYAPLAYAREPHERYLALAKAPIDALFVGMNPGPFGMAQTGVPFGEIAAVRGFLAIDGRVRVPRDTHPKRPVQGFACTRAEVSGQRFWGLFSRAFASRDACFDRIFVWNYAPLAFVSATGANITPDKLPRAQREALESPCNEALVAMTELLRPRLVIGVGAFARAAAERALKTCAHRPEFAQILHPSPASPAANRGWEPQVRADLVKLSVIAK